MSISEDNYPTAAGMLDRWKGLITDISQRRDVKQENMTPGELLIIGSGISHIDFTSDSTAEIKSADYVFYCLYDRITQIWLSKLRPDAFDLYVLYDDQKPRYDTYVQMAEAMLHYVRMGKKVVAIYYGHPGIFATPTHRAIQIARREGHRAIMRPGISALDYLVAEVGFDPALPGLLSYEASDMLLRRRNIDQSLHLVIWQVGLVGDFGFRREGFLNDGFPALVKTLEEAYSPDWKVTHYIASRFVGIDPLIEEIPIGLLNESNSRGEITALSTFYIAPYVAVVTDRINAEELKLIPDGGHTPRPQATPDTSQYGPAEIRALGSLSAVIDYRNYTIPVHGYEAEFLIELSQDVKLQNEYRRSPESVLSSGRFPDLSERARKLLAIPHPHAFEKAIFEANIKVL